MRPSDAGVFIGRHIGVEVKRGLGQDHAQSRPRALAQVQAEIEQRPLAEMVDDAGVLAIVGNMSVILAHPEFLRRTDCFICNEVECGKIFKTDVENFDYDAYGSKVSTLEPHRGQGGWLAVHLLTVKALGAEEQHVMVAAVTHDGTAVGAEDPEKLLRLPAQERAVTDGQVRQKRHHSG